MNAMNEAVSRAATSAPPPAAPLAGARPPRGSAPRAASARGRRAVIGMLSTAPSGDRNATPLNARLLALAGAVVLALAAAPAPAPAQQGPAAAQLGAAAAVGRWLYDDRGEIIGSVKSLSPDGRTAVVALGIYLRDYVRLVEVPAGALAIVDGKATLLAGTAQASNLPSGRSAAAGGAGR